MPASAVATPELARPGVSVLPLSELMEAAQKLQAQGQTETAAGLYRQWLQGSNSPARHVAWFNLGTLLSSLGQTEEVEQAYREALALRPDFAQAHLNLGHQLERKGQVEPALAHWRQVIALNPPPELHVRLHAYNNCARLLETQRRYPKPRPTWKPAWRSSQTSAT